MSDVYTPPESELLATSSGGPPPTDGRGVYPVEVGTLLSRSWEVLQPMLAPAALATLAIVAVQMVGNMPVAFIQGVLQTVMQGADDDTTRMLIGVLLVLLQIFGVVIGQLTQSFLALGMARGSSKMVTTGVVEVSDFLPFEPMLILRGFGASLLYLFVVTAGTCAFIVPGIMATFGLILWPYAMVVEGHGPVDALKRSWQLTDGAKLSMFGFSFCVALGSIVLLPLTLCIGLLVVLPFTYVAYGLIFEGARAHKPALEVQG